MKVDDIRSLYLDFFQAKDHRLVASDSLAPQNDPTLLFTGAGMNQFKENFLGLKKDLKRATSCQKCLRTGDLDDVGRTSYHHSFFEMLGNFSFGDYFKPEAIQWAWDFLTRTLQIPPARLRISVHKDDEEAFQIWRSRISIPEDHIYRLGDKSNFWPSNAILEGPNGPCGPCSEIYYDISERGHVPGRDLECGDFAEIWNLVFTQYNRRDGGKLEPLASKNIDTGMGLERLACVLQGKKTNFEIDSFAPLHEAVLKNIGLAGNWSDRPTNFKKHLYRVSDHLRAVTFAIGDGVIPSNEGRGYVIRKLIRRALWNASQISPQNQLREPILHRLVAVLAEVMRKPYPELTETAVSTASTLKSEEEKFLDTLEIGLKILKTRLKTVKKQGLAAVPGELIFELYDTYGFPEELTRMIAESEGLATDQAGFENLMEKQRQRAKDASQIASAIFVSTDLEKRLTGLHPTRFLGYENLSAKAKILDADIRNGRGTVVLDQTPFYGESGGQAGDRGILETAGGRARVVDTQKKDAHYVHAVEVESGILSPGTDVTAKVDVARRSQIMRNHTATHLLHAALRQVLGTQVRQLGSYVGPDKLRFDYAHGQALSADQIRTIENLVNERILADTPVDMTVKTVDDAKAEGALAFFGDKYGQTVRVVSVPGFSMELCGGTHCRRTGEIGMLLITAESAIASGTRRVEAVTGFGALNYARTLDETMTGLAQSLKTTPDQVASRIAKLRDEIRRLEKEKSHGAMAKADPDTLVKNAAAAGKVRFVSYRERDMGAEDLRRLGDRLRSHAKATVFFLAAESGEKIQFVLGMSPDLDTSPIDLRDLLRELSPLLGASGGGRKNMAQGGSRNTGQLDNYWNQLTDTAVSHLSRQEL